MKPDSSIPEEDALLEEIHAARRAHAAQFNYDLDAILADLKRIWEESKQPVVSFPPRRQPETSSAT